MEPFFTFEARIPPPMLRELSLDQIAEHLLWWNGVHKPDPAAALMAMHPKHHRRTGG